MDVFEKALKKIEHDKKYLESCCQCANIGPTGPTGPQGPTTITIRSTVTGEAGTDAYVKTSGNDNNLILDFVIPRGNDGATGANGATGPSPDLYIGQVTTGSPGTQASVTIRKIS